LHTTCAEIAHHIKSISKVDINSGSGTETTTTVEIFINTCKNAGFSLDRKKATEILNTGVDPSWLSGAFSYPEFIGEEVQKNYQDKPPHEKRKLFMALLTKEDKKDLFPEWRKTKEVEAAAQEERYQRETAAQEKLQRIDQARSNKPKTCGTAGALSPSTANVGIALHAVGSIF